MVGPSKRHVTGTLILFVYCLGELILVFLAYFIRDWRWLQLSLAIPMVLTLCYWTYVLIFYISVSLVVKSRAYKYHYAYDVKFYLNEINMFKLINVFICERTLIHFLIMFTVHKSFFVCIFSVLLR